MPIIACRLCGSIGFAPAFDAESGICPGCRPPEPKPKAQPSKRTAKAAPKRVPKKGT